MKSKTLNLLMVCFFLGVAAYLDSPYSFINKNYSYSASQPVLAQPLEQMEPANNPTVQEKLVKKVNSGGYTIETYREYDVYKDQNGNITKKVPTSRYDELKYWDYKSQKK